MSQWKTLRKRLVRERERVWVRTKVAAKCRQIAVVILSITREKAVLWSGLFFQTEKSRSKRWPVSTTGQQEDMSLLELSWWQPIIDFWRTAWRLKTIASRGYGVAAVSATSTYRVSTGRCSLVHKMSSWLSSRSITALGNSATRETCPKMSFNSGRSQVHPSTRASASPKAVRFWARWQILCHRLRSSESKRRQEKRIQFCLKPL